MKKLLNKSKKRKIKTKATGGFFNSKTAKLFFIIIILMAIPLTVLSMQQVQNYSQFAAEPTDVPKCDGTAVIYNAEPNPVNSGEFVTFSKTDGTEVSLDTNHFGNGYDPASCVQEGANLKCKTKSRGSGSPIQYHKWAKYPGGTEVCWYAVAQAPTATPDPNRPTATPRTGAACTGNIKTECTFDNKPRLVLEWDLRGGVDADCAVEVYKNGAKVATMGNDCDNKAGVRLPNVENDGTYNLLINNGKDGCKPKNVGAVTASCDGGNPTNTPIPQQPTQTPTPHGGNPNGDCTVELNDVTACTTEGNIMLKGSWSIKHTDPSTCKITLFEGSEEKDTDDNCENTNWHKANDIQADKRYTLQIESDLCSGSTPSVTAKACTPVPASSSDAIQAKGGCIFPDIFCEFFNW